VTVREVPKLVQATELDPRKPLDELWLTNFTGTCTQGIFLAHVRHAVLRDIRVTGYSGALLNTIDVTGKVLDGARPFPASASPAEIPAPVTPYKLH
jgi:hypothetical protein